MIIIDYINVIYEITTDEYLSLKSYDLFTSIKCLWKSAELCNNCEEFKIKSKIRHEAKICNKYFKYLSEDIVVSEEISKS